MGLWLRHQLMCINCVFLSKSQCYLRIIDISVIAFVSMGSICTLISVVKVSTEVVYDSDGRA